MFGKHVHAKLQRLTRFGGNADAMSRPAPTSSRELDPSTVDAVFSDEATIERAEPSRLLASLRKQLAALESQQTQLRKLLDQVDRRPTGA